MADAPLTREQRKFFESKFRELSNDLRYHRVRDLVSRRLPVTKAERAATAILKRADGRRRRLTKSLDKRANIAIDKARKALLFDTRKRVEHALEFMAKIKL